MARHGVKRLISLTGAGVKGAAVGMCASGGRTARITRSRKRLSGAFDGWAAKRK